ncbi:MAG: DUF1501 domain-containing protein [Bacteroidota bacterium]
MKRRDFVRSASLSLSVPMILGGTSIRAFGKSNAVDALLANAAFEDRVLVLVRLNGGNDGLNTFIPIDQYSNLSKARGSILIPEDKLQNTLIGDKNAFHPVMTGFKELYDTEKLAILQSVGYPKSNGSHFRSTDIWTSATASDVFDPTGWMGRYLDNNFPGFPNGYPNEDFPDPLAITVGNQVSQTCQGPSVNMSMALANLNGSQSLLEQDGNTPDTPYGHELSFLRQSYEQTNKYNASIQTAAQLVPENLSELYPQGNGNKLANELRIVARLIAGGLKTKIYVVDLGGFDTHANQVQQGSSPEEAGRHVDLLSRVSQAITAFQDDITLFGIEDRVLGMTFSEFGRRIISNDSYGTDHGTAAPLFVFGSQVNPRIFGENPLIPDNANGRDNLPMQYDFRAIYSSVLSGWFGASEEQVQEVLFGEEYTYIPIVKRSPISTSIDDQLKKEVRLSQNYPNPFRGSTRIPLELDRVADVQIKVYDPTGQEIATLVNKKLGIGKHEIPFEGHGLAAGNYYYRMQVNTYQQVKLMQVR